MMFYLTGIKSKGGYTRSTSCFQHVESNLLPVATFEQLLSNFSATSCFQHVESNLLPVATFGQHVESNMLKATCCLRQLLGNFWSTCWKQLVERNLLNVCIGMLLMATCCWINYDNELLQDARAEQDVDLTNASLLGHIIVALVTYMLSVLALRWPYG